LTFSKVSELSQQEKFPPDMQLSKMSSKTYGKLDNFKSQRVKAARKVSAGCATEQNIK